MVRTAAILFWCCLLLCSSGGLSQVSIKDTRHNLSVSGTGTIKAASEQEVCVFCHTPHHSTATAQLWNRQADTVSSFTLYSSDYLTSKSYTTPGQPKAKSKLCLSCHDGTIALGSVYNTSGSGTTGSITMANGVTTMPTGAAGYLGKVLTDDHPVGYVYDNAKDPELAVRSWPWGTSVKLDPDASNGTVECETCHDPHNNQYTKFLRMDNTDAGLCTFCHAKTAWTAAGHNSSTQAYTPPGNAATTVGEWACRNCHRPHGGTGTPYILRLSEENTCYQSGCHGSTSPGSTTKNIQTQLSKAYAHPTNTVSGKHIDPDSPSSLANRHAECQDCHNPHQASSGTHDGTTRSLSGVLKGAWGVEPNPWPAKPTGLTNNTTTLAIPTAGSYQVYKPAQNEYEICLKCHSNYTTQPVGQRNIAAEINPNYPSYHGIVPGGTSNIYCNTNSMNAPWGTNKIVWCSDCHGSETTTDPNGPHGSNNQHILWSSETSDATNGTPFCYKCHKRSNYWDGPLVSSRDAYHPSGNSNMKSSKGCFACHMYEYNGWGGIAGGNSLTIYVHGQNKVWKYLEQSATPGAGSGQDADAFTNGYLANVDFATKSCWTEGGARGSEFANNCNHTHSNQGYNSAGP